MKGPTPKAVCSCIGPLQQQPIVQMTFALRSQGDPTQLVTSVRQGVLSIDPDQPIAQVRTRRR